MLEEEALRNLPLNATNGRDAVQLLVQSTPSAAKSGISGTHVYSTLYLGGANSWTNTAYIDGVGADAGPQGAITTPALKQSRKHKSSPAMPSPSSAIPAVACCCSSSNPAPINFTAARLSSYRMRPSTRTPHRK